MIWCQIGADLAHVRGEGGAALCCLSAVRQSRQRWIERKRAEDAGGGERGSGREFAVNNEKRLPRCAPGKAKPQPVLKQTLAP